MWKLLGVIIVASFLGFCWLAWDIFGPTINDVTLINLTNEDICVRAPDTHLIFSQSSNDEYISPANRVRKFTIVVDASGGSFLWRICSSSDEWKIMGYLDNYVETEQYLIFTEDGSYDASWD